MTRFSALPLSLRQLQYVVAVAEYRNFRLAASKCFVSQPSLSTQIAELESTLHVQIFERDPKGAMLTEAGEDIVRAARRVLDDVGELQQVAQRHVDPRTTQLRLGVIPTLAPYLLPELTAEWSASHSELRVSWIEDKTEILIHQLERGELDGALLAAEAETGKLELIPIVQDEMVLIAAPGHPLAESSGDIELTSLREASMLLLNDGHCFRDQALDLCHRVGATADRLQATSLTTLVQMAASRCGVTLIPRLAVAVENRRAQVRVRRFCEPRPFRTLAFAVRRRSPVSELLKELVGTVASAHDRVVSEGCGREA